MLNPSREFVVWNVLKAIGQGRRQHSVYRTELARSRHCARSAYRATTSLAGISKVKPGYESMAKLPVEVVLGIAPCSAVPVRLSPLVEPCELETKGLTGELVSSSSSESSTTRGMSQS